MAVGDKVEAETKKALGLGENDDLEAYCKRYEDIHAEHWRFLNVDNVGRSVPPSS